MSYNVYETLIGFSGQSNGNLGILPLQTTGRIGQSLPLLRAHAGRSLSQGLPLSSNLGFNDMGSCLCHINIHVLIFFPFPHKNIKCA